MLAAFASSDAGQDPLDTAIRAAAATPVTGGPVLVSFVPFDPAVKRSGATDRQPGGTELEIVKGAYSVIAALDRPDPSDQPIVDQLQSKGYRVIALAAGPKGALLLHGLIALCDPPRADSAALVAEFKALGVRTVMVTCDAPLTAGVVA